MALNNGLRSASKLLTSSEAFLSKSVITMEESGEIEMAPVSSTDSPSMQITTVKLNGANYFLWAHVVKVFLRARGKLKFIMSDPLSKSDKGYEDWECDNYLVMTWLWNSMEPSVSVNVMFFNTAKEVWDAAKEIYSMEKKVCGVYDLYENMFLLQQGDKSLGEYYGAFKGMLDELNRYHPSTNDLELLKKQCEEFQVSKFLFGLNPNLQTIRNQILAGDGGIPSLSNVYTQLLKATVTSSSASSLSSVSMRRENSTLLSSSGREHFTRGRGTPGGSWGRGGSLGDARGQNGHGHGGRSCGCGCGEARSCTYCDSDGHTIDSCWNLYGKPTLANQSVYSFEEGPSHQHTRSVPAFQASTSTNDIVTLSREEYSDLVHKAQQMSTNDVATFASSGSEKRVSFNWGEEDGGRTWPWP